MSSLLLWLAILGLSPGESDRPPLVVERAWTRATPPGAPNGAGYLRLLNHGDAADRLLSAESPAAEKVEVHRMSMKGGVMSMGPLPEGVVLPPHGEVTLEPGGVHLMLLGLKEPLVEGKSLQVTLHFEHAAPLSVTLRVAGIGAKGPP